MTRRANVREKRVCNRRASGPLRSPRVLLHQTAPFTNLRHLVGSIGVLGRHRRGDKRRVDMCVSACAECICQGLVWYSDLP
jgi:hypothetical protein